MRRSGIAALRRLAARFPVIVYLGAIMAVTGILAAGMIALAHDAGVGIVLLTAVVALSLVAASQLAVALVNWWLTLLVTPRPLPRMDFSPGIPAAARTVVVVPSMLTDRQAIEDLVEALEVRYLANQDANLHFALLTDFLDAARGVACRTTRDCCGWPRSGSAR